MNLSKRMERALASQVYRNFRARLEELKRAGADTQEQVQALLQAMADKRAAFESNFGVSLSTIPEWVAPTLLEGASRQRTKGGRPPGRGPRRQVEAQRPRKRGRRKLTLASRLRHVVEQAGSEGMTPRDARQALINMGGALAKRAKGNALYSSLRNMLESGVFERTSEGRYRKK